MNRPVLIVLLSLAAITAAGVAATAGPEDRDHRPRATSSPPRRMFDPAPTPVPPDVSRRQLDRQDRLSRTRRRAESAAHDQRPLLTQLPLTRAGVTIDLVGLHRDGRHVLLAIRHPHRTRRHARAVYRRALQAADDTGHAYRAHFRP